MGGKGSLQVDLRTIEADTGQRCQTEGVYSQRLAIFGNTVFRTRPLLRKLFTSPPGNGYKTVVVLDFPGVADD